MAPKKTTKMSYTEFMTDESLGKTSWADEMEDMPTAPSQGVATGYGSRRDYADSDRGYGSLRGGPRGGDREDRYPPRQQLPLPDKPPYTAHVGNLSWDVLESDLSNFFSTCDVVNVRLVRDRLEDRPKGFGYVEFGNLDGLKNALELNGSQLAGRHVRINVAEPPKDRGEDRTAGEWRRTGPLPPLETTRRGSDRGDRYHEAGDRSERRSSTVKEDDGKVRDFSNWERKGPLAPLSPPPAGDSRPRTGDRRRSPGDRPEGTPRREPRERPPVSKEPTPAEMDTDWRRSARPEAPVKLPTSPVIPQTRPKLELKKRSETATETPTTPSDPTPSGNKPNPFGAAKPIDTDARLREVEEKRAALAAAKRDEEERLKEEAKEIAETEANAVPEGAAASPPEEPFDEAPVDQTNERHPEPHSERHSERRFDRPNERRNDHFNDRNAGEGRYKRNDAAPHKAAPGATRDWGNVRRGPPRPIAHNPRRNDEHKAEDRQTGKAESTEAPRVEPAEEGWSTVPSKRSRGPANGKPLVAS